MSCDTFTYTIFIGASPDKIWDALTSTEHTFQYWSGRSIESDWQVGATIEMHKPDGNLEWHGTIKKCDPSKEMIYTWELVDAYENGLDAPTLVHIGLDVHGHTTRLTLTHSGFSPHSKTFSSITQGWPAILSSLKSLVETEEALKF